MRTNLAMLAVLAGVGLSIAAEAVAESKNLSCISEISPNEQRLLRDCEPTPEEEIVYVLEVLDLPPPPPPPPIPIKNGEGGKGGGAHGHDRDHDAPAGGGDPGPSF
jgi:hypothetical protein